MGGKGRLRSGYTTGACAAAAAGAAVRLLCGHKAAAVEIPLPARRRVLFPIHRAFMQEGAAFASVIKDAGDDPDVTNGAEIGALVRTVDAPGEVIIKGGAGVGVVTRPGLPVAPGEPAINPVPRAMIRAAVREPLPSPAAGIEVAIVVPDGERLAEKTLNHRLGIVGGISILGTTGIVTPMSAAAWTATVASSLNVAAAMGLPEILLSSGRTSEKAAMAALSMPDYGCVLMGDYVEFSLREAGRHPFARLHLAAQWAKMVKIAMGTPDTHVRAGVIELPRVAAFLRDLGVRLPDLPFNTAREMLPYVEPRGRDLVCRRAEAYGRHLSGKAVVAHLVSYHGAVLT